MLKSISAALLFAVAAAALPIAGHAQDKAAPATALQMIDEKVGTGREVQVGRAALVHYTGWLYDE